MLDMTSIIGTPADLREEEVSGRTFDEEHALLAAAREQHPWGQGTLGPVLLRHDDVRALLRCPDVEQLGVALMEVNGVTSGPLHEWWSQIMFANEGEKHHRMRSVAQGWLTPKRVADLAEPVRSMTEKLIGGFAADEVFDLAGSVADRIPISAICTLLGVDPAGVAELGDATTELGMAFGMFDADERLRIETALEKLLAWGDGALSDAGAGTLARVIVDAASAGEIDHDEAVALITNLLFAAHDTTRFLIANALWELGRNRLVWQDLVDGRITGADVVEETLRFQPPAVDTVRVAIARTRIGDLDLEPGQLVGASLRSAARDPRVYDDPDRFDPGRTRAPLLSFGQGAHFCIGAALARLESTVVLDTIAASSPDLRIDSAGARQRTGSSAITGIDYLPAQRS